MFVHKQNHQKPQKHQKHHCKQCAQKDIAFTQFRAKHDSLLIDYASLKNRSLGANNSTQIYKNDNIRLMQEKVSLQNQIRVMQDRIANLEGINDVHNQPSGRSMYDDAATRALQKRANNLEAILEQKNQEILHLVQIQNSFKQQPRGVKELVVIQEEKINLLERQIEQLRRNPPQMPQTQVQNPDLMLTPNHLKLPFNQSNNNRNPIVQRNQTFRPSKSPVRENGRSPLLKSSVTPFFPPQRSDRNNLSFLRQNTDSLSRENRNMGYVQEHNPVPLRNVQYREPVGKSFRTGEFMEASQKTNDTFNQTERYSTIQQRIRSLEEENEILREQLCYDL